MIRKALIAVVAAAAVSGCSDTLSPGEQAKQFSGRWGARLAIALPPVALSVRAENGGHVGQVWLSGVTYTLPARFEESKVVLADQISSAPAAFVGTLLNKNTMSARLGNDPVCRRNARQEVAAVTGRLRNQSKRDACSGRIRRPRPRLRHVGEREAQAFELHRHVDRLDGHALRHLQLRRGKI
jgi:hypothetical protein